MQMTDFGLSVPHMDAVSKANMQHSNDVLHNYGHPASRVIVAWRSCYERGIQGKQQE